MVEFLNMHPNDIIQKVGGRKVGANDWRIPDLCNGETQMSDNPGTTMFINSKGETRVHCHRCGDHTKTLKALYAALGIEYTSTPEDRPRKGRGDPIVALTGTNVREKVSPLFEGVVCPICRSKDVIWLQESVNGWPIISCPACMGTYHDTIQMIGQIISPNSITYSTRYTGDDGYLFTNRAEPGKHFSGNGSNIAAHPKLLLWDMEEYITSFYVVVTEGEKAAAAALSSQKRAFSWRGAKDGWKYADITPATGLDLICWPDNHPEGRKAMYDMAQRLSTVAKSVKMVLNDGRDNQDAANFKSLEVRDILVNDVVPLDKYSIPNEDTSFWMGESSQVPMSREDKEELEEDVNLTSLPWYYHHNGLADIRRIFRYFPNDCAYIEEQGQPTDTPTLMIRDKVGYWHPVGKGNDHSRLNAMIIMARRKALEEALSELSREEYSKVAYYLHLPITSRIQNDCKIHLGTQFHLGNLENIPVYSGMIRAIENRNLGMLTLQSQCIDMAKGQLMEQEEVSKLGIIFDPEWSKNVWVPGASQKESYNARNIRALMENLGDVPTVITEMLMTLNRRIALVKSKGTGRGKSLLVLLMRNALGSLVGTHDPRELTDRALSRQFPTTNNIHCQARIVMYQEADKYGLDKINLGGLVHVSGEGMLSTEYKGQNRTDRPRLGNPFLTMGEWTKKDKNGLPMIDWNIQGMFDRNLSKGRLWACDLDVAGAEYLPEYIYDSVITDEGREAFIDYIISIAVASEGVPDPYTNEVLETTHKLMDASIDVEEIGAVTVVNWDEQRRGVIPYVIEYTDRFEDYLTVQGLAAAIDERIALLSIPRIPGSDDRRWSRTVQEHFGIEAIQAQVVDDKKNVQVLNPDGKRVYPIRGMRWIDKVLE